MPALRRQPFTGRHLVNVLLSRPGSEKRVHHHEIGIESGPLACLPGDAVGVSPRNDPALVERVLHVISATGSEPVVLADGTATTLEEALLRVCSLDVPGRLLQKALTVREEIGAGDTRAPGRSAERVQHGDPAGQSSEARDVLDVLEAHPKVRLTPAEFVAALRRLPPRLYSLASSPLAFPGRVHLLVASVRYTRGGRERRGVSSTWLEERWPLGETAPFYLQDQQKHFAMPPSPDTPMIMVGPGTGVAPFRAFLQQRRVQGARGRNWLFFGAQRRATDFLYEDELTGYVHDGHLRLDLAFSRDQPHKVYVQDRMRDQAQDIWEWLENGAEFFVCGDKNGMAADVDRQLHEVIQTAGRKTADEAREYVGRLTREKRYKRDVY